MRKLASLLLAGSLPTVGLGIGLGDVTLHSGLNQPLNAEAEIFELGNVSVDDLQVQLAPKHVFEEVGIERPFYLTKIKYKVEKKKDGRAIVKMTTQGPVSEPYLDFLVSLNWSDGQVFRNYTLLLDPPTYRVQPRRYTASRPQPRITSAAQKKTQPITAQNEYGPIQANETLWSIARELPARRNATLNQVMVAIVDKNPQAFIGGNMNRLRQGAHLALPTRSEVAAYQPDVARQLVKAHGEAWRLHQPLAAELKAGAADRAMQLASPDPSTAIKSDVPSPTVAAKKTRKLNPSPTLVGVTATIDQTKKTTEETFSDNTLQSESPRVTLRADNPLPPAQTSVENSPWLKNQADASSDNGLRAQMAIYAQDLQNEREINVKLRQQVKTLENKIENKDTELRQLETQLKKLETRLQAVIDTPGPRDNKNKAMSALTYQRTTTSGQADFNAVSNENDHGSAWLKWLLGSVALAGFAGAGTWFSRRYKSTKVDMYPFSEFSEDDEGPLEPSAKTIFTDADPLEKAAVYLTYQRYTDAERTLLSALEHDPDNLELRFKLLDVYAQQGAQQKFTDQMASLPMERIDADPEWAQRLDRLRQQDAAAAVETTETKASKATVTEENRVVEFESGLYHTDQEKQLDPAKDANTSQEDKTNNASKLDALAGEDVIATMLDLAMVYVDMGDHTGAKDILQKVMKDGNEEQQQEAKKLLARFS